MLAMEGIKPGDLCAITNGPNWTGRLSPLIAMNPVIAVV